MKEWMVTDDARMEVLEAACSKAEKLLKFAVGGRVVSTQDGDDERSRELVLPAGFMYRVRVEFEAMRAAERRFTRLLDIRG